MVSEMDSMSANGGDGGIDAVDGLQHSQNVQQIVEMLKNKIKQKQEKVVELYDRNLREFDGFMKALNESEKMSEDVRSSEMKDFEHAQRKNQRAQQNITEDLDLLKYKLKIVEEQGIPQGVSPLEYLRSLKPQRSSKSRISGASGGLLPDLSEKEPANSSSLLEGSADEALSGLVANAVTGSGGSGKDGSGSGKGQSGGMRQVFSEMGAALANQTKKFRSKQSKPHAQSTEELSFLGVGDSTPKKGVTSSVVESDSHHSNLHTTGASTLPSGFSAAHVQNYSESEAAEDGADDSGAGAQQDRMESTGSASSGPQSRQLSRSLPRNADDHPIAAVGSAKLGSKSGGANSASSIDEPRMRMCLEPLKLTEELKERLTSQENKMADLAEQLFTTRENLEMTETALRLSRERQHHQETQLDEMSAHFKTKIRQLESGAEDFAQIMHTIQGKMEDVNQRLDYKVTNVHDKLSDKIGDVRENCELIKRRLDNNPLFASAGSVPTPSSLVGAVGGGAGYSPLFVQCFNILGILVSWLIWLICQAFNFFNICSAVLSNKVVLSVVILVIAGLLCSRLETVQHLYHSVTPQLTELLSRFRSRS